MKLRTLFLASLLGGLASFSQAAEITLDDFDSPSPANTALTTISPNQEKVVDIDLWDTNVGDLETTRRVRFGVKKNPLGSISALSVGDGVLTVAQGVKAEFETLIFYGRNVSEGSASLGLDLSQHKGIRFRFTGAEDVMNLNVVLYTRYPADPDSSRYYASSGINIAPSNSGDEVHADLEFRMPPTPFNWQSVDGVTVLINRANAQAQTSYTLDSLVFYDD